MIKNLSINSINEFIGYGGGIINRKIILTVLLLLSLTLPINAISATSADHNTTDNTTQTYQVNTTTETNITTDDSQVSSTTNTTQYAAGSDESSSTIIKVLIYSGTYASSNCVNGLITALTSANTNNLVSGVTFTYATSTTITSTILSAYDVLIMPGGSGGYYYLNYAGISGSAIKSFVANGGAYIGICAGAYAAAAHTDGYYDGWGIAPHVYCKAVAYEGTTTMTITSAGESVLNRAGTVTLAHYNGAAMYLASTGAVIFGTYADSNTGYKGYADIVGDYYGNGRTVLIGSHPELSPQYPDIIANLIVWATNTSTSSTNNTTNSTELTIKQVTNAAGKVKRYYDNHGVLPDYVIIDDTKYSMSEFLYLASQASDQIISGSTSTITTVTSELPSQPNATYDYTSGNISKSDYKVMAKKIVIFIEKYGRAPNYVACSLGQISYTKLIDMFARILNFYNIYGRLPNYVSV